MRELGEIRAHHHSTLRDSGVMGAAVPTTGRRRQTRAQRRAVSVLASAIIVLAGLGLVLTFTAWWEVDGSQSPNRVDVSAWSPFGMADLAVVLATLAALWFLAAWIRRAGAGRLPVWPLRILSAALPVAAVAMYSDFVIPPASLTPDFGSLSASTTATVAAAVYAFASLCALLLLASRTWADEPDLAR